MKKRKLTIKARIQWLTVKLWFYQLRYGYENPRLVKPLKELVTLHYSLGEEEAALRYRNRMQPICSSCNQPCASQSAIMQRLSLGTMVFREKVYRREEETFRKLNEGQKPHTMMITCADSRVDPRAIVQARLGELFVLRNAGNIVVPHDCNHIGGEAATIEYAVAGLKPGVGLIVICGHTPCGAMKTMLNASKPDDLPAISAWLKHAEDALKGIKRSADIDDDKQLVALTRANVLLQLEHLRTHPSVVAAMKERKLELHGWVYRMELGHVEHYDLVTGQWNVISEEQTIAYCKAGLDPLRPKQASSSK
jgi:carbonic anhydrase